MRKRRTSYIMTMKIILAKKGSGRESESKRPNLGPGLIWLR